MRFTPIAAEHFARFHASFRGDTPETFRVCAECGGACEFNKIGTLMPGEPEFMAASAGLSVTEFSDRFLDTLEMDDGMELDVLRLTNGCPFLHREKFVCMCREYKVVLCEIYPIGFQVRGGKVVFGIDDWCPLADTLRFRRHFLESGVSALERLPVPVEWYEHVARYDDLYFDYVALEAYRHDQSERQVFSLAELLPFQREGLEHDPKVRFHPYPAEVVPRQKPPMVPPAIGSLALPILGGSDGTE